jgi:hypothetical protein
MNDMCREGQITDWQKYGIIVCIPKQARPMHPEDYRLLTLLYTDYKLLTRIIAKPLRPWLTELLHLAQHCGLPGPTVFEALATIRDAVAYAELTGTPLCLLSIDFKEAFDNISHDYLIAILREHGFSEHFQRCIQNIYNNASSAARQGCPMNMLL